MAGELGRNEQHRLGPRQPSAQHPLRRKSAGSTPQSVVVAGTGVVDFLGVNAYTGTVTVSNGSTLLIDGNPTVNGTVSVTGILAGAGTLSGAIAVVNGGTLSPAQPRAGTSIGGPHGQFPQHEPSAAP